VRRKLQTGWRLVSSVDRVRKRRLRNHLRQEAHRLRPGLWIIVNSRVARHCTRGRPPALLWRAKIRRGSGKLLARAVECVSEALCPPVLAWIPRTVVNNRLEYQQGIPGVYTIVVIGNGDDLVLLSQVKHSVLRLLSTGLVSTGYVEKRIRFSQHLSVPGFEIVEGGRGIREQYIDGHSFADLDAGRRLDVTMGVFRGYATLSRHEAARPSTRLLRDGLRSAIALPLPDDLMSLLMIERRQLLQDASTWPLVPSHGDPGAANMVIKRMWK
jgi:hypothetical protein